MIVEEERTIQLNSLKYHIKEPLVGSWQDPFPEQQSIGDPDYSNRRDLSSWMISGERGIGVEEMDERKDLGKCWWTNCITQYKNHLLPPRKATALTNPTTLFSGMALVDGRLEIWTDADTLTNWTDTRVNTLLTAPAGYTGSCARFTSSNAGATGYLSQVVVTWSNTLRGQTVTARVRARTNTAGTNEGYIQINDGVGTAQTATALVGDNTWQWVTVSKVIDAAATSLTIRVGTSSLANLTTLDVDDVGINVPATGTVRMANFNSNLYVANGNVLMVMNAGRTALTVLTVFYAPITAIIASLNTRLYIFLGDYDSYWFMSTAGAFTEVSSVNGSLYAGKWAFQHDAKLFKCTAAGVVTYSTDPDTAGTPTWSAGGTITDIASQIEGFLVGRDASGTETAYCATHSRIKALDLSVPKWFDTEAVLPNHPTGGRGHAYWNGEMFFSYGLAVKDYYPETGKFIDVGLTVRDGLPAEYNGEITKLYGEAGSLGMFATVDASIPSGNSQSGLYIYDGEGWHCWWTPPSTLIDDCESATGCTPGTGVAMTADTTDFRVGSASIKFAVGLTASGTLGTTTVTSADISKQNYMAFWIKSSVALDANDLYIGLLGVTPQESIYIPAIAANTWTKVNLALNTPATDTTVTSWRIVMAVDKGAFDLWFDQIEAHYYDGAMYDIIVSSAGTSAYAVYFDHAGIVNYIDIPRGIENPDKISQSYGTAGIFISPWFDANNMTAAKLAKALTTWAKGVTTTETVALKYRLDHTYTDLDSGWTTMDTLNTTAESGSNEELFASGAGLSYKAIQFRLDFVTAGSTAKADILSLIHYYKKRTGSVKKRRWQATVICDNAYQTEAKEKIANLKSAIESDVDVLFSYHPNEASTEQFYVDVMSPGFTEPTGRKYDGAEYKLVITEV